MAQKTNLNSVLTTMILIRIRILFARCFSCFAIQARELTQLQSQLQYQIETHGTHIFKEGAMVVLGIEIMFKLTTLKLATQFGSENVDPSKYYNATTPVDYRCNHWCEGRSGWISSSNHN